MAKANGNTRKAYVAPKTTIKSAKVSYEGYTSQKAHDKAIQNTAKSTYTSESGVKNAIWKIKNRFYRYDLNDKESLQIFKKYTKSGWGSLDAYLNGALPIDILGYKKFYSI